MRIVDGRLVPELKAIVDELKAAAATVFNMTSLSLHDQITVPQADPGLVLVVSLPLRLCSEYLFRPIAAFHVISRVSVDLLRTFPLFLRTPLNECAHLAGISQREGWLRECVEERLPLEPLRLHHSLLHTVGVGGEHHRVLHDVEQDKIPSRERAEGRQAGDTLRLPLLRRHDVEQEQARGAPQQ
jgi:hypothetical protein